SCTPVRESEAVDPAERSGQHSDVECDAIDEMLHGKLGARLIARLQVADVIADAGQALQPAFAIKKLLNRRGAHALVGQEIKKNTRIDLAWPRAHRQSIER